MISKIFNIFYYLIIRLSGKPDSIEVEGNQTTETYFFRIGPFVNVTSVTFTKEVKPYVE